MNVSRIRASMANAVTASMSTSANATPDGRAITAKQVERAAIFCVALRTIVLRQ